MSNQIYTAMSKILKEVGSISKGKTADMGTGGKYQFRGIDDMYNALHEIFAKNEVFMIPKVLDTKLEIQDKGSDKFGNPKFQYSTILTMEFTFASSDGSSITAIGVGHAIDSGDKGTNKAQSSALKYCLMQTFLIPTEEDKDVENSNLEVGKSKNQTKNSNQKPPPEPPKPVKTAEEEMTIKIVHKLKNNFEIGLENAKVYLLENQSKISVNLFKEATDLITQKENQPKVEIKYAQVM